MISATVNGSERVSASGDDGAQGICSRMSLFMSFSQLSISKKCTAILSSLWDMLINRSSPFLAWSGGLLVWMHGYTGGAGLNQGFSTAI